MTKQPKGQAFDPEYVRDLSVEVYKERLGTDGAKRMLEEDGPEKIRRNSQLYDPQVIATLRAINKRHDLELGIKNEVKA